jgi:plastocyanin
MNGRTYPRRAVAWAIAAILVGGAAAALVETGPARAASEVHIATSGSVAVTAVSGFSFQPNEFSQVPTGANVSVTFTDADTIGHTFSILDRQGVVIPPSTSEGDLNSLFATYGALFSHNLSGSGDHYVGTFTAPSSPGWYEFVCLEPGHFQNGMFGFIAFGMSVPSNLSTAAPSTNPGAPVFIIVGTIVALVVIALVLGFVVGRRRGSTYEMPPERLGYPEPEPKEAEAPSVPPTEPRG